MVYIFLIGLVLAIILVIGYFLLQQKTAVAALGLSWSKSIFSGLKMYFLSIFLGTLSTSIVQNAIRFTDLISYFKDIVAQVFVMFFYAVLFTILIVLPFLVIGIKYLSKTNLNPIQKQVWFIAVNIFLVFVINLIMSVFFSNPAFMIFLLGYSIFGVITPWVYVLKTKIFAN